MPAQAPGAFHSAPAGFLRNLARRLLGELGFRLAGFEEVDPGVVHNNRLFRLRAADGREAMAKLYLRDGRHRMEREYDTLGFLGRRGLRTFPVPLARSGEHYYAVYSLEAGENRPAAQWTTAQAEAAARVCVELDRIRPEDADIPLRTAFPAGFSHEEGLDRVRGRLGLFAEYAGGLSGGEGVPPEVRDLCASADPVAEVEVLLAAFTRGISATQREARVPEQQWRLDVGDYAPHNVLIRPAGHADGPLCVLDLEYAGWDDPVAMCALFATADQSLDLPRPHLDALLRAFQDGVGLLEAERARMERVMTLLHIARCAIHLQLLVPELIEKKRFASPTLAVSAHRRNQIAKFHCRVGIARAAVERLTYPARTHQTRELACPGFASICCNETIMYSAPTGPGHSVGVNAGYVGSGAVASGQRVRSEPATRSHHAASLSNVPARWADATNVSMIETSCRRRER